MKKYIWGTGRLTGMVLGRWISIDEIEGFIDNDANKKVYMEKAVYAPKEMLEKEFDAILVANLFSEEIREQCIQLGIDMKKVIFCTIM